MCVKTQARKSFDYFWDMACDNIPSLKQHPKPFLYFADVKQLKRVAGTASSAKNVVSLNEYFLETETEDMLNNTIPHELAHIVTDKFYPYARQAHGPEFKLVMETIFETMPTRCHSYDLKQLKDTGIIRTRKKVARPYLYKCGCDKPHNLTANIHKKIQNYFQKRICRTCNELIIYVGKV